MNGFVWLKFIEIAFNKNKTKPFRLFKSGYNVITSCRSSLVQGWGAEQPKYSILGATKRSSLVAPDERQLDRKINSEPCCKPKAITPPPPPTKNTHHQKWKMD